MSKALSIDKRIKLSSELNQTYFYEYLESFTDKPSVWGNYRSTLIRLIESIEHKPLDKLTLENIESFLLNFNKISTFNTQAEYIKNFCVYLSTKTQLPFSPSDIDTLKFPKKDVDESIEEPVPLTFEQIIKLRSSLKAKEQYDWWLTFELCYQLGEKKFENIPLYNTTNYDAEKKIFTIKKKTVHITPIIENLISNGALPTSKKSTNTFYNMLKEIEKILGRKIEWRDINATRKLNFLVCPRCRNSYENKPENWVVYEYQEDSSRWLVCKPVCYHEVYNERN